MVYQVLVRARADGEWEPFQGMTRDPIHTMRLLQQASRKFSEVSVLQAESATLLREQLRRLRAGAEPGEKASPVPSLSGTPRISVLAEDLNDRRWSMEQGRGGDHDVPYRFDVPGSSWMLTRWAQLVGRMRADDTATEDDIFPEDLSVLEDVALEATDASSTPTASSEALVAEVYRPGSDQ